MKRRSVFLLAIAALATIGVAPALQAKPPLAKPKHIMSMNECNDLVLLMLVPKDRIASITYLAHDAVKVLMPGADRGIPTNHGTSEEILLQRPDLILASPWSTPIARELSKRVNAPIIEVEAANDFEAIRHVIRQIAGAVGEPTRGEALIAQMDGRLAALAARKSGYPLRVVAWTGDSSVPGRGTLTDAIIKAAGGINIGAKLDKGRYSSFGLEELLAARPDALMQGVGGYNAPALRESIARHPLIDRLFSGRQIDYPDALYTCGLPQTADAAWQLADAFAKIRRGGSRW